MYSACSTLIETKAQLKRWDGDSACLLHGYNLTYTTTRAAVAKPSIASQPNAVACTNSAAEGEMHARMRDAKMSLSQGPTSNAYLHHLCPCMPSGFDVKLMRTCLQPQPVLPPPAELLPAAQADSAVATAAAAPPPAAAPAKSVATGGAKATSKAVMGNNNSSSSGGTQPTQRPRGNSFEGAAAAEGMIGADLVDRLTLHETPTCGCHDVRRVRSGMPPARS